MRRARELVIVAMLLALPVLFLRANLKSPSELNLLDRIVLRISAPIEAGLTFIARGLGHAWSRYVYLVHVTDDNARLREENEKLRSELSRARQESVRGEDLEQLLHLRAGLTVETAAARVVGAETSAYFRVLRVRLDHGDAVVRPGMPVISTSGVVGRVQRVFGPYSDVLLATDPKSSIDIVVPRTGGRGVLKGVPGTDGYRTRLEYLLRSDDVAVGDAVTTSGLGAFPRDLRVGTISKITKADFGLYQEAEVAPAVDFSRLEQVLIVLTAPADVKAEPPPGKP
jgi:rod shape-determining protein MreC